METQGFDLSGKSLFVALPAYDFKVSLKLAVSLARMAQDAVRHGVDLQMGSICGCSILPRARNLLVQDMLESDCDYLLFIDSDINFDPSDVFRLMVWAQDPQKGIIAGVPRVRSSEEVYIAKLEENNGELTLNGHGLVRAERVATAFMLIQRKVLTDMAGAHPEWKFYDIRTHRDMFALFNYEVTPEGFKGEDYLFCDRVRELGYEVWIDPSIQLGHMGVQEYEGFFGRDILFPMIASVRPQEDAA